MDKDAPAKPSRKLEEELSHLTKRQEKKLSCIRYKDPTWWVKGDIFEKKGTSKTFSHDQDTIAKEARKMLWRPCNPFSDNNKHNSAPTHMALQQMGVGIGHPMYLTLMIRYHP